MRSVEIAEAIEGALAGREGAYASVAIDRLGDGRKATVSLCVEPVVSGCDPLMVLAEIEASLREWLSQARRNLGG